MASITWGATYPMIDYAVSLKERTGLAQSDFLVARFGLSALCLIPLLWMRARAVVGIWRDYPWRITIMGASTIALYNWLQLLGQNEVNPSVAAVVIALEPLLAFLMAWAVGLDRPDRWKVTGLFLALAGLTIMTVQGGLGKGGAVPGSLSLSAILVSPACWAVATVLGKPVSSRHDPLAVAALSMVIGTIPLLPMPWLPGGGGLLTLARQPSEFYWVLGFMVAFPTVLSILLWYSALRHLSVMSLSAYLFLTPVHGVLISSLWREAPALSVLVGGAVILLGVGVISFMDQSGEKDSKNELNTVPEQT